MKPPTALLAAFLAFASLTLAHAQKPKLDEPAEPPAQPSKLFPHLGKHLVIITGEGHGSGSIIKMGEDALLVTNAHVLSGMNQVSFSRVDGTQIKATNLAVANGADIATLHQTATIEGLELMKDVGSNANIGDDVVVLGNSLGGNVITEIPGKIVGIGPSEIEVDAKFVHGNSGSPIIHVKTGKVVGIATYSIWNPVLNPTTRDSKFTKVRRFGFRLDTVPSWTSATWAAFQQEAAVLAAVTKHSTHLQQVILSHGARGGLTTDMFDASNRLRRPLVDYLQARNQANLSATSKQDARNKFFRTMIFECGYDLPKLQLGTYSDFHARDLRKQIKFRDTLKAGFQRLSAGENALDKIEAP